MEEKEDLVENKNLKNTIIALATPISVVLAVVLLAISNLYSTQILLVQLNRIEKRLPQLEGEEIVPVKVPSTVPSIGKNNAPVTIVEFADFQCPFCKEFNDKLFQRIKSQFIDSGKVRFVYMHYPFLGEESIYAAEATECAKEQGKFWQYHDLLFQKQGDENAGVYGKDNLKKYASELNLDQAKFDSCLDTRKFQKEVQEQQLLGTDYGVTSTPTIFINGRKFEGIIPLYKVEQVISSSVSTE